MRNPAKQYEGLTFATEKALAGRDEKLFKLIKPVCYPSRGVCCACCGPVRTWRALRPPNRCLPDAYRAYFDARFIEKEISQFSSVINW